MRRYVAHPGSQEALLWLHRCLWLARGLNALTALAVANLYLVKWWESPQWAYQLAFCGVGVVVSAWQVYLFLPRLLLREHL